MLALKLHADAQSEILEIAAFYAEISADLHDDFLKSLNKAINLMREYPGMGSMRFAHLMRGQKFKVWTTNRFPFRFFFYDDKESLFVVSVEHESRNVTRRGLSSLKGRTW